MNQKEYNKKMDQLGDQYVDSIIAFRKFLKKESIFSDTQIQGVLITALLETIEKLEHYENIPENEIMLKGNKK